MRRAAIVALILLALPLLVSQALAFQQPEEVAGLEMPLPAKALVFNPSHARAVAVEALMTEAVGGTWSVYSWNPILDTPRWIIGSGFGHVSAAVASGADPVLQAAARTFVLGHPELFRLGTTDLVDAAVTRGAGKVAVHFTQNYEDVPVLGGFATALYTEAGRLAAVGAKLHADIEVSPVPSLSAAEAIAVASAAVAFDSANDHIVGEPELVVVPTEREGGVAYYLTWKVVVATQSVYAVWESYVDAHSGDIVYRFNRVNYMYSGQVSGPVDDVTYCQGTTDLPFGRVRVDLGNGENTVTEADGSFVIEGNFGAQPIDVGLDGPECRVINSGAPEAAYSATIQPDVPLAVIFDDTNSDPAERSTYYWTTATERFIQSIDPSWNYTQVTARVNVDASCNANWTGTVMNFFRASGGCGNTGRIGDVVAHEFGHCIQFNLIGDQGEEGLGEGNSDIAGTFMVDDPVIGRGFSLDNCASGIRNCDNNLIYPDNVVGQGIHSAGRVICGFNWDARQELEASLGNQVGEETCGSLWHFSRKVLRPRMQPDQVLAYFLMDDDDGDITNGTPNYDELCAAAGAHNFACPELLEGVIIQHNALDDTFETTTPYTVSAVMFSTEAPLDPAQLLLHYSLNLGSFETVALVSDGSSTYTADIPAQPMNTLVQYYITAADQLGHTATLPESAPAVLYSFFVGALHATVDVDMEEDPAWTVGPNTATAGFWERVDPVGIFAYPQGLQVYLTPEDDQTPDPGVTCWITEQDEPGGIGGAHDVDNGVTRLVSASYDLSGEGYARLEFYLWFSNDLGGNPGEDPFVVEVSTNGGTSYSLLESSVASTGQAWKKKRFDLTNFVALTDAMRFRFSARDDQGGQSGPSLVEAGVDDFRLLVVPGSTGVDAPALVVPPRTALAQNQPNPFNPTTEIAFSVGRAGRVELAIYDVEGARVRSLVSEVREPGHYAARWDGVDDRGVPVASGIYFYRLDTAGAHQMRKMVLLK